MTIVLKRLADISDPMVFDTAMREKYPSMLGFCYQEDEHKLTLEFSETVDAEQVRLDTGSEEVLEVK